MALSPSAIANLDAASRRIAAGRGSAQDIANVEYAKKRKGYVYKPQAVAPPPADTATTPTDTAVAPVSPTPEGETPAPEVAIEPTTPEEPAADTAEPAAEAPPATDSVSKILSGLQVAVARQKKGTASKADLANIAYATKKYGFDPATMTLKKPPSTKTPIPADQLGQGDPYAELSDILGSNVTADMVSPEIAGLLALQASTSKETQQYDELTKQLTDLMGQQGNMGADMQAELDKQGVPQMANQIKELNLRAAQLQGEIQKFDAETGQISSDINQQAIPTGLLQGQQAQLQQQRDLTRNSKTAEMAATISLSQAYGQNLTLAQSLAEQAISLKYQPIENQLAVLEKQIGFAGERMSRADQKRAGVISAIIEERKAKIQEAKDNEKAMQTIAINAAADGAPLEIVNQIRKAKDQIEAAGIAGRWIKQQQELAARSTGGGGGGRTTEETTVDGQPQPKPVKLSAAQASDVSEGNTMIELANEVLRLGDRTKWNGVGGFWRGSISEGLSKTFGAGDDNARTLRSMIGNIKATIAKARGGTSFTVNEEKLLNSYTPNINESPKNIKNKLKNLIRFIEKKNKNIINAAGEQTTTSQSAPSVDDYLKSLGL